MEETAVVPLEAAYVFQISGIDRPSAVFSQGLIVYLTIANVLYDGFTLFPVYDSRMQVRVGSETLLQALAAMEQRRGWKETFDFSASGPMNCQFYTDNDGLT